MTKRKLRKELSELARKSETVATLYSGSLGIYIGGTQYVDVPNRPGFVYVRLRNNISELIQAHNEVVSPVYGLPVLLIRNKTYYEIYGRDTVQYASYWDSNSSYLPKHGHQHEFDPDNNGGGDLVFVHGEQFYPMMTFPSGSNGSNTVLIAPYRYFYRSQWYYTGNTGVGDLLQYGPTGANDAKLLLVGVTSATGNPFVKQGSEFSEGITGAAALTQFVPTNITPIDEIPGAIIRLVTGTQTITWANIYDARQYMGILQAGSGTNGATTFLGLTDTPSSYAGQANKLVSVKADESGLEFISSSGSSGGGSTGTVGRVLIQTNTPNNTTGTSFQGIPASYGNLEIVYAARVKTSFSTLSIYFNADYTTNNYLFQRLSASSTSVAGLSSDGSPVGVIASTYPYSPGFGKIYIPNYAGTYFNKQANVSSGWRDDETTITERAYFIDWENHSAINRIDLVLDAGNFTTGTVFYLYGEEGTVGGGGAGATTFLGLTDTPNDYSGQADKLVVVNSAANGLEFRTNTGSFGSADANILDTIASPLTSGNNDNYNPSGYVSNTDIIIVYGNSDGTSVITGLAGGRNGRRVTIHNGDYQVNLAHLSMSSDANKIFVFNTTDGITLGKDESITLYYDTGWNRWFALDDRRERDVTIVPPGYAYLITGSINDWSDYRLYKNTIFTLNPTGNYNITGLYPFNNNQELTFINIGTGTVVTFQNEATGSTDTYRLSMGSDNALGPGKSITLWYDAISLRWRALDFTTTGSSGGGNGGTTIGLGFYGQDEAVGLGTGTTLNVVGDDISLSISGTVLTLLHSDPTGTPHSFLDLTDTPDSYSGQGSKYVAVNSGGTALEFVTAPAGGGGGGSGLVIYDDSVYKVTGTAISFDSNLSVAVTGSVAFVSASASTTGRTLIATSLPSGTTVTFSAIPNTYKKLEIDYVARSSKAASTFEEMDIQFNSDTTATNYRFARHGAYGTNSSSAETGDSYHIAQIPAASSPTNSAGAGTISIPFYAAGAFNKQILSLVGLRFDSNSNHEMTSNYAVEWENAAAITQIDIKLPSGNFITGTTFCLYGLS